jgi:hypothetical protein
MLEDRAAGVEGAWTQSGLKHLVSSKPCKHAIATTILTKRGAIPLLGWSPRRS